MSVQIKTSDPILTVEHVAVHFGGLVAISDMNFEVHEGELVSLIGPNGAGKTTAFNVITGFQRPTKGHVTFRGTSLNGLKPHQVTALGLVRTFQRTSVFDKISVFENVLIGLHRRTAASLFGTLLSLPKERRAEEALREEAWEILRLVGIEHEADELGGSLPYGDQRLLGVALALAASPHALLLDEPVSGMNASETARFIELLDKLRAKGTTILLVEHDMPMVMGISDRVVVLNYGRIIANGPPSAIQSDPEVIKAYLGGGIKHA
ncbi:ABC transporter ATP-binding protein [Sinorhizobium meliloti]|jgi:branched-chain amino acid transport system ATP-binding protein|uniref:ABC transporter ATP-binding protein n=1 Tax=Rhizobium meliloti TaxID=382 RepID=UPI0002A55794|nr:ABC transporter ATP-binding protein [Sinorhizobium meliloti]AGA08796.1 ABC-type branched-chain amino acid transport systems, ATPase component [Sinorhizobium meliloti GR4]ATB01596.1 ABC transporter ATP-binding protein [Sinorhizobium meliloti]MDE3877051.1 ABC transporter ATP-binding protein [Sinorhizobium meliloti]MDW9486279.1 ATP-binding cassette domain-containing protein [Sinorhizobium meliloti]MDW9565739.1 ATP-binding cassette domain-containing protein [Sinorhizobium meliloti]